MGEKKKTPSKADSRKKESCKKCRQEAEGRTGKVGKTVKSGKSERTEKRSVKPERTEKRSVKPERTEKRSVKSERTEKRSVKSERTEKRSGKPEREKHSVKSEKKVKRGDAEARKNSDTQCSDKYPGRREEPQKTAGKIRQRARDKDDREAPDSREKNGRSGTIREAQLAQRQADREELTARRTAAMAYEQELRHKIERKGEPVIGARPLHYLALGDSITTGTNNSRLKGVSYSDYLAEKLTARYGEKNVIYRKSITPGYTVRQLHRVMESYLPEIRVADVITVSIGGNDLLGAGRDSGYAAIDMKKARAGVEEIKRYLPKLVDRLRQVAGEDGREARILIMNLYNPYCRREQGLTLPSDGKQVSLHDTVGGLLGELDGVIRSVSGPNVLRVDTAAAFEREGRFGASHGGQVLAPHLEKRATCEDRYTHFYDYPYSKSITTLFLKNTRDPHPTDMGHRALADAHWGIISPVLP